MMKEISDEDVQLLRGVLDRLREFDAEWSTREDDPEDMWIEAPEMAANLISKMKPVVERLEESSGVNR